MTVLIAKGQDPKTLPPGALDDGGKAPATTPVASGGSNAAGSAGNWQVDKITGLETLVPTTPTTPPAGSNTTGRYPSTYTAPAAGGPAQSTVAQDETAYQTSTTPEDPAAISSRINSEYASEIASIKQYYNSLISQQNIVNTNESGKTRATVSSQGELGQDMGNAAQAGTDQNNQAALDKITAEEANAVGAVQEKASGAIESEITGQKSTAQTALAQKTTFDQAQSDKAVAQLATIAGTTDLASLPQNEYDSLYEASGFATPEQFNTYYNAARQSALTGGKTVGDATTGVWQQQLDGTWKVVIPSSGTIGDPTSGVWKLDAATGKYTNIIPAAPKVGSIGAGGSYVFNPSGNNGAGSITTVAPAAKKFITSGGILYSVDPTTNKATALAGSSTNGTGWSSSKAGADQEKAAIISYVKSKGWDVESTVTNLQKDPTAYYDALGQAAQAGYYTNLSVGIGTPGAPASTDTSAAANATADASDNLSTAATDTTDTSSPGGSN